MGIRLLLAAGMLLCFSVQAAEERVSTALPFERGDVLVAATVMDDPDDDHKGTGRYLQYDANLEFKGVLWIEGTRHKIGALSFAPDGTLWGFAPISWQVIEVGPDARQKPMRQFATRAFNGVVFAPDGSLYFNEHLVGTKDRTAFNTTRFRYMPGTQRVGDGHIFRFTADGRLLEEYPTEIHGGVADIHGNSGMVLADDGNRAIYFSETGNRLMQYDLANRKQLPDLATFGDEEGEPPMVLYLTSLGDGTLAAATGSSVMLIDPDSGATIKQLNLSSAGWAAMTASVDEGHLLLGNFFTGEIIKLRIEDGEVVARNSINEQNSLSGIAQFAGAEVNPYEEIIRSSEEAFMKRDLQGSIENLDQDYVLYDIKDDGPVARMRGRDQVEQILGQFFSSDQSWVDSTVDKWGLLDNILVQVEYDDFETDQGVQTIPTLVVFEHRDGKRWREWRFSPRDR